MAENIPFTSIGASQFFSDECEKFIIGVAISFSDTEADNYFPKP